MKNLIICSLLLVFTACSDYKLVLLSQERGAACLDGSPTGMFINEGTGVNKTKYMLFFNGGGFCGGTSLSSTIESCYQRSNTLLGTTKFYPESHNFDNDGLLSTRSNINENFHDWTKVFIIYCDGSSHQGYREAPISYKGTNLYFRGTRNTLEQFRYLDKTYDFYNGDTIVVTGISAGGMGAYQWSNYVHQNTKKARVLSMPDSGFFITNYFSPIVNQKVLSNEITNLLNLVLSESELELPDPVRQCIKTPEFLNDYVSCFDSGNYGKFLTAPTLIIQSPYDQYSLFNIVVTHCLSQHAPYNLDKCNETARAAIEDYRSSSIKALNAIRSKESGKGVFAAWGPACIQHGFSGSSSLNSNLFKIPTGTGQTLSHVISTFINNTPNTPWLLEEIKWPANQGCSGETSSNLRENLLEQ